MGFTQQCASHHKLAVSHVNDARRGFGRRVGATAEGRLAMPCIIRADILKALFKSGVDCGTGGPEDGELFLNNRKWQDGRQFPDVRCVVSGPSFLK